MSPQSAARPRSPSALILLASGAVGALPSFAHAAFIPIALAILFALSLSSPVEALNRRGILRLGSAVLILILLFSVLAAGVYGLLTPAQKWLAAAPHNADVIQHKIAPATRIVQRIEVVSDRAGKLAGPSTSAAADAPTAAAPSDSQGVIVATRTGLVAPSLC